METAAWREACRGSLPGVPVRGTVYGVALNTTAEQAAIGDAFHAPPYKAPPVAPVLYIKPANTWSGAFDDVVVPPGVAEIEVCAGVAIVMAADASRVPAAEAWSRVLGLTLVCDLSIPSGSFFRPPVRFKCHDGFCPIGPWIAAPAGRPPEEPIEVTVHVNGELRQTHSTADLLRDAATLVAEVSEFMTLRAGDALLLGCGPDRPRARCGDVVGVRCAGVGRLDNRLVAAPAEATS